MALGTLALYALIISVSAALMRKKIPRLWRSLHMFNYLVFYLILVHSLRLGSELQDGALRYLWLSYAVIVVAGQIYRLREGFKKTRLVSSVLPTEQPKM